MPNREANAAPTEAIAWALVQRTVTDLRREPDNASERVSQALLGEGAQVLEARAGWARVRLDMDGYTGWLHAAALHPCPQTEVEAYHRACNALVPTELLPTYLAVAPMRPERSSLVGSGEAGKLPFGVAVVLAEVREMWAAVRLPNGQEWWATNVFLPLTSRPRPDATGLAFTLDLIRRFMGVPYLWGGRTPFGFDCSGLAQAFWGFLGVHLPRDAHQQFAAGTPVEAAPEPGDLAFFGEANTAGERPISHVAISLGGDEVLHANSTTWNVALHSLDPHSSRYHAWLGENLVGVRRFA